MRLYSTKKIGDTGEKYTSVYLKKHGYKILERNYRKNYGEIDIIAQKRDVICFVEVKTRHSNTITQPYEAVDFRKQNKIVKTAAAYLVENKIESNCRFDVCEVFVDKESLKLIKISYIQNAFDAENTGIFY
jgi:putative endonuclease